MKHLQTLFGEPVSGLSLVSQRTINLRVPLITEAGLTGNPGFIHTMLDPSDDIASTEAEAAFYVTIPEPARAV